MQNGSIILGPIVGAGVFGIPSAIVAMVKGFRPFRWMFAFGVIGLFVVTVLPSARSIGLSEEEQRRRLDQANRIGDGMCAVCMLLYILCVTLAILN